MMQGLMDLVVMTVASRERSESEFRELLGRGSFKVKKIWRPKDGAECLIEAEL